MRDKMRLHLRRNPPWETAQSDFLPEESAGFPSSPARAEQISCSCSCMCTCTCSCYLVFFFFLFFFFFFSFFLLLPGCFDPSITACCSAWIHLCFPWTEEPYSQSTFTQSCATTAHNVAQWTVCLTEGFSGLQKILWSWNVFFTFGEHTELNRQDYEFAVGIRVSARAALGQITGTMAL